MISIYVRSQNARAVPVVHVCERYVACRCVRVLLRRDLCLQRAEEAGERTHSRLYRVKLSFPAVSEVQYRSWCFHSCLSVLIRVGCNENTEYP